MRSLRRSERRSSIPQSRRIEAAPFIIDDGDIFGDGVNIAARLEGIAEPGGICISDDAHRQICGKVDAAFDDMGPQTLKNIAEPTRVWCVRLGDGANPAVESTLPLNQPLALPDKPSIAVLPFQNMSGDPEQDYFADGMVDDIITGLSRIKWLFVIGRNSTFIYKCRMVGSAGALTAIEYDPQLAAGALSNFAHSPNV